MDELVVVGGLVPSLLIDQANLGQEMEPHVGTLDLDIGLSLAVFDDEHYRTISERLRSAGFEPDTNEQGKRTNQRWKIEGDVKLTVDFLIPPSLEEDVGGRLRNLEEDFAALIAPGLHLAFRDQVLVTLTGQTIFGENATREVRVCGPGAFMVLKAYAFANRGENKDAYDLYYVVRNYDSGPEEVANKFLSLYPDSDCEKALDILRRDFFDPGSVGAMRATAFIRGEGVPDDELLADVAGFVQRFVDHCTTDQSSD
jgi:predicted nucleotidyltransferase